MKKIILTSFLFMTTITLASAFSNSLDRDNTAMPRNNNFAIQNNSTPTNIPNTPYNPKGHSSYEHNNSMYSNQEMNDTRYNSNCQFGQCIPGGMNPVYK